MNFLQLILNIFVLFHYAFATRFGVKFRSFKKILLVQKLFWRLTSRKPTIPFQKSLKILNYTQYCAKVEKMPDMCFHKIEDLWVRFESVYEGALPLTNIFWMHSIFFKFMLTHIRHFSIFLRNIECNLEFLSEFCSGTVGFLDANFQNYFCTSKFSQKMGI